MYIIARRNIGNISLAISVVGLIVMRIIILSGYSNGVISILVAGFEAATVGGCADWFAVTALFRKVPIPLLSKHTDIIVRNRKQLTKGAVDLVANKWLAPEIIEEKIAQIPISKGLIAFLENPQNNEKVVGFIKTVLYEFSNNLKTDSLSVFLQNVLKDQIKNIDLAASLGRWLKARIQAGDHNQLWESLLDTANRTINSEETRNTLREIVKKQIENYKDEGFFKDIFLNIAEFVGAVDEYIITDKLIDSVNQFISNAKNNPSYPVRYKFDTDMLNFAENLIHKEAEACKLVSKFQKNMVDNADLVSIINNILDNLKRNISKELSENNSSLTIMLRTNINEFIKRFATNEEMQQKTETWLKDSICGLVERYHSEIGNMVETSLSHLKDRELVQQLEDKVGTDLQYIRLNGAVIGGLVGMFIAIINFLLEL